MKSSSASNLSLPISEEKANCSLRSDRSDNLRLRRALARAAADAPADENEQLGERDDAAAQVESHGSSNLPYWVQRSLILGNKIRCLEMSSIAIYT